MLLFEGGYSGFERLVRQPVDTQAGLKFLVERQIGGPASQVGEFHARQRNIQAVFQQQIVQKGAAWRPKVARDSSAAPSLVEEMDKLRPRASFLQFIAPIRIEEGWNVERGDRKRRLHLLT